MYSSMNDLTVSGTCRTLAVGSWSGQTSWRRVRSFRPSNQTCGGGVGWAAVLESELPAYERLEARLTAPGSPPLAGGPPVPARESTAFKRARSPLRARLQHDDSIPAAPK